MSDMAETGIKKSTIVRSDTSSALVWTRRAFSVLERFAPVLGTYWATRLWFMQPVVPAAVRQRNLPKHIPARKFEVDTSNGCIRGWSWGRGPNVYLVHGWGGWGLQLAGLVEPLVRAGYRVVSFDMPSHGDSDPGQWGPRSSTLAEFVAALHGVIRSQGEAHALVGHSMGATATAAALREGVTANAVVFVSPMADPVRYTHGFAQLLGFGENIRSRLQKKIEHRVGLPMEYYNVPRMARDLRTPSLLVIHDRYDRETAWSDGQSIAQSWPQARLISTERLGHRKILSNASVIHAITQFLGPGQPKDAPAGANQKRASAAESVPLLPTVASLPVAKLSA
jgi:pimeloyl-ACP methyl ester carboxylesterase